MSAISNLLVFGQYLFLIVPSILLVLGLRLIRDASGRRRILFFLCSALLALAALALLIGTNPYGREINSSIPAFALLPVLIALLVILLSRPGEIARLWSTDRAILAALFLITPVLFGLLWLVESTTFYLVVGLTAGLGIVWLVGTRSGLAPLTLLTLVDVGALLLFGGGAISLAGPQAPAWMQTGGRFSVGIGMLLAIFLAASLLYTGLRGEAALSPGRLGLRLALIAILIGGVAYQVFWDGVWSAAHERAFEDHLPFAHFMFSLIAGVLLALSLAGWRRWAGLAFVLLLTGSATLTLIWGWKVSAFELTERRAARVEAAITRFQQAEGRYPTDLGELTPRYLLYLPPPVVVRGGGWCYQGGADTYRLGYVSGKFTYFTSEFQAETYAQAGRPPAEGWICDQVAAMYAAGELGY